MTNISKVRYAVLVALIGMAFSEWPTLPDKVAQVIEWISVGVGALWAFLRIAGEFIDQQDPMVSTRGVASAWAKFVRAL